MTEADALTRLSAQIHAEIRAAGGVIPFSRFMDLALYLPGLGYYEREAGRVGRAGDFMTSVSVGPLFGELLARQFAEWAESEGAAEAPFQIVEAAAHDGRLAQDVLGWLREHRPHLFGRTQYHFVEPSPTRRAWQREHLDDFVGQVHWVRSWSEFPDGVRGVIFANELLDAFPARRLVWEPMEHGWVELGVTAGLNGFAWARLGPVALAQVEAWLELPIPAELRAVLPSGFVLDLAPAAVEWWREAALALRQGHLLTFDYGLEAMEMLTPRYAGGTLRGYRRHRLADSILAEPGAQDLTAHVNFTSLAAAGASAGLSTEFSGPQRQFLTRIATQVIRGRSPLGDTGALDWTPSRLRQFQTLTHPEHLGRAFRALVQRRTVGGSFRSDRVQR